MSELLPPRRLLAISALIFALAGLSLLFFPLGVARAAGLTAGAELPAQLVAGGLLALAVLDWAGRGAVYGGIYGRPLVLSNFAFSAVTGGSLASASLDGRIGAVGWIPTVVLLAHAVLFWALMRRPPWPRGGPGPD